jgi:predicted nucleotidyltransferase
MDFVQVIEGIVKQLDDARIRFALIGGFAVALRGVQRATIDLDFILMLEDLPTADTLILKAGYERTFRSKNVSHYTASDPSLGRIDILHAFRGPSLSMLERAERMPIIPNVFIPVVQIEDLIGLKIQAACNDPHRKISDWSDIQLLMEAAGRNQQLIDWELLSDYLELFDQNDKLPLLRTWYGSADRD